MKQTAAFACASLTRPFKKKDGTRMMMLCRAAAAPWVRSPKAWSAKAAASRTREAASTLTPVRRPRAVVSTPSRAFVAPPTAAVAAAATGAAPAAQQAASTTANVVVRTVTGAITGTLSALMTPKGLLAVAAVGLMFGAFHVSPRSRPVERAYTKQIVRTLGKVATPAPFAPEDVLLARPDAAAALATALDPAAGGPPGFFLVVSGSPGAGKTTLVRLALRELAKRRAVAADRVDAGAGATSTGTTTPLPGGCCYVAAAPYPHSNFGRDLAATIGFGFEEGVRALDQAAKIFAASPALKESATPAESLARAAAALEEAARELKARGAGRPLVVIDAADRLARRDPDALLDMVDYAKDWAERGLATVVFVVGDPTALNLLRASPSFSRAAPLVEVAGPSPAEATDFLRRRLEAAGAKAATAADPDGLARLVPPGLPCRACSVRV
jgi:type II secretory pathway predicted ATPase ExeA